LIEITSAYCFIGSVDGSLHAKIRRGSPICGNSMSSIVNSFPPSDDTGLHGILDESEQDGLLRLTKLVERLFRVPVAYMALLGPELNVVTRIGSGTAYWPYLKRIYSLTAALAKPFVWSGPSDEPGAELVGGDLKFSASAPLRSSDGTELGLLVIADVKRRPHFSAADVEALAELAAVLAGKMELRTMACEARETGFSLKEAESRFRNIANSAPVLIIFSGADGGPCFVNKTWLDFTGRSLEEEIPDGFAESFHPDYRERAMEQYWEAFQARRPLTQEFPMRRHDGEYRWMLASGMPRFQSDGTYAGYIGCFIDMTEQRSARLGLQKQKQCTAAIAEALGAMYFILDAEGKIEQCSRAFEPNQNRFIWEVVPEIAEMREMVHQTSSSRKPARIATDSVLWILTPILPDEGETAAILVTAVPAASPCSGCSTSWA